MTVRAAKTKWTVLIGLAGLLAGGRAYAQTTPCAVDTDCPGNAACGGDVCTKDSGGNQCTPPNPSSVGFDGWCADANGTAQNSNCKCRGQGATCNGFYCTFTSPPDGSTTGTGGAGGGTGGSGTAGSGTAGSSAKGGSSGSGGGGGCSVAGAPSALGSAGAALMLAAALVSRRRRRR
jgi:MYXO-CTERM domain-containing protein